MARRTSSTFTEVELEFMKVIWELGEVTTETMQNALDEKGQYLTNGSIRKILSILLRKGRLERNRSGLSFYYRPVVPEKQGHRIMVLDLLRRTFDGSATHLVAALLDSREVTSDDLREIKRLIEEREREEEQ